MNGYDLSRDWFDWCFDNPEKINPNHSALYFFIVEHCNRMGWKEKFGLPTSMAKDAIGIRSYGTYIKTLNDLVEFGFVKLIEKSKNQYSSNIVALSKNCKAHNKALDKAISKHTSKQVQSTRQSIDSIDKQYNNKPNNNKLNEIQNLVFESFKRITNKSIRAFDTKAKTNLSARLKEGYTIEEIEKAIKNCYNDKFHQENKKYLTLEFILRADKLSKYSSIEQQELLLGIELSRSLNWGGTIENITREQYDSLPPNSKQSYAQLINQGKCKLI